jgi:hypothetical protein
MAAPWLCQKTWNMQVAFNIDEYVQVTDLGIEKNHNLNPLTPDVE